LVGEIEQNIDLDGMPEHTKDGIISVLLEALSPDLISPNKFVLENYLNNLLQSVGHNFNIQYIILRKESSDIKDKFDPLAYYGLTIDRIEGSTDVWRGKKMVDYLEKEQKNYYMPDLFDPENYYEQKEFARKESFKSAFACPIITKNVFVGFIIYFKKSFDGFNQEDRNFLGKELNKIIQNQIITAESIQDSIDNFIYYSDNLNKELNASHIYKLSLHDIKNDLYMVNDFMEKIRDISTRLKFEDSKSKEMYDNYLSRALMRFESAKNLIITSFEDNNQPEEINNFVSFLKEVESSMDFKMAGITRKIYIISQVTPDGIKVVGYKQQLRSLFRNIFNNAQQAIEEAKKQKLSKEWEITTEITESDKHVMIKIKDNGVGIRDKQLNKIHLEGESFWMGRESSGAGLAICKKIIDMHEGTLNIKSQHLEYTVVDIKLRKTGEL
jgi:signal transduction histidine kinase